MDAAYIIYTLHTKQDEKNLQEHIANPARIKKELF